MIMIMIMMPAFAVIMMPARATAYRCCHDHGCRAAAAWLCVVDGWVARLPGARTDVFSIFIKFHELELNYT